MINRYEDNVIKNIWSEINKINIWLNLELSYVNSLYKFKDHLGLASFSDEDLKCINNSLSVNLQEKDLEDILEIELSTKHDFVAFLKHIESKTPNKSGRWLHYGLTSSDIIDTANSIRCVNSLLYTRNSITSVITTLLGRIKHEDSQTEILSRTHGQAAEIQKVANVFERWLSFARRSFDNVTLAEKSLRVGKLSGPSGNYVHTTKEIERDALSYFNLNPFKHASQIISRDVFLDYFYAMLKAALFIEKVAYDIRLYSQSEIKEICEGFAEDQKGSSAMPHKKNPILCENLTGLSRMVKGYVMTAIDNCETQWERDISHSSTERIIFEDCAHLVNYGLHRLNHVLTNLVINKDNCKNNINKNRSKLESQNILNKHILEGYSRFDAHTKAQETAR